MGIVGIPGITLPGDIAADLKNADPLTKATVKATTDVATELGMPLDVAQQAGMIAGALHQAIMTGASTLLGVFVQSVGPVLIRFLDVISKFRSENAGTFAEIGAAVLSEMLATDIPPPNLKAGKSADETIAAAREVGSRLLARLEQEFTDGGKVSTETGAKGAATFAGYGVNFAVQNTLISTMFDALSDHFLEEFRELGPEVARNIGLGRLVRRALSPLVDATIAKPYTRALSRKYRQDHISEKQLVTAMHRGTIPVDQVKDYLAQKGYPDPQITELLEQLTSHLTDSELALLIRWGKATNEEALKQLQNEGWPAAQAQRKLDAIEMAKVETIINPYINWLEARAISGEISLQAFDLLLQGLPLSPLQREWENKVVGAQRETPRTKLTLAQMRTAYFTGLITLDDWDAYLDREGYSGQDATLLTYQLLHDAIYATERERRKAALVKRGVDHLLSFSQVKAAFKAGLWTQDRVKQWLGEEGFNPQDAADMLLLITGEASGAAGRAALPTLRAGQAAPQSGQGAESG